MVYLSRVGLALAIALDCGRDCAALASAKGVGKFGGQSLIKMRRVGHYFSHLSDVNLFFKVQVVTKLISCPRGKSY